MRSVTLLILSGNDFSVIIVVQTIENPVVLSAVNYSIERGYDEIVSVMKD